MHVFHEYGCRNRNTDAKLSIHIIYIQSTLRQNCYVTIFNLSEQHAGACDKEHTKNKKCAVEFEKTGIKVC
jgi:hypothetical protein